MDSKKLKKANELKTEIEELENGLKEIEKMKCQGKTYVTSISIGHTSSITYGSFRRCNINTEFIIIYMETEINKELNKLEIEFEAL